MRRLEKTHFTKEPIHEHSQGSFDAGGGFTDRRGGGAGSQLRL
jgi:hypothetical protein